MTEDDFAAENKKQAASIAVRVNDLVVETPVWGVVLSLLLIGIAHGEVKAPDLFQYLLDCHSNGMKPKRKIKNKADV